MADNVVRFRKVEKKPEKPAARKLPPKDPSRRPLWPNWLPWVAIVALAVAIVAVQESGLLGG